MASLSFLDIANAVAAVVSCTGVGLRLMAIRNAWRLPTFALDAETR